MRAARTLLVALAAAAAMSACGGRTAANSPFDTRGSGASSLRVNVDNQNFNDVRIFALSTRGRQSVGSVGGRSTASFQIPWQAVGEVSFRLDFLAADGYNTNRVNVAPGDVIELQIGQYRNNTVIRRR